MYSFEEQVKEKLEAQEKLIETFCGRTQPTSIVMKLLSEVSLANTSNMAIRAAITNRRIMVYKQDIQETEFSFDIQLTDISEYTLKNELLSGSLFIIADDIKVKFTFKKERLLEIKSALSKVMPKANKFEIG